ncbi:MAG: DUF1194 domain-containing protein [Hyphomicrobiaceae bacterium]
MASRAITAWLGLCLVLLGGATRDSYAQAPASSRADLTLVLAVDVSLSMDLDEQRLQRDGYVAAFRDPVIWKAIASGPTGRIAVTYMEWAGIATQNAVIPWTLIDGPEAARAFAAALEAQPISRARFTSISGALAFSRGLLDTSPFEAPRRVIDVSGDGPNNSGPPVLEARAAVLAEGIVINGLPIMLKIGGGFSQFDLRNLDQYYADCVIGGPGSFSLPVNDREQLTETIRRKLLLEIADLRPVPGGGVIRTQAPALRQPKPVTDCLIGEKMWQDYQRQRFRE